MYTEQELSVLEILEGHSLPTIVLSSPRVQLPILAKCYHSVISNDSINHLCSRVSALLEPHHMNHRSEEEELARVSVSQELLELLECVSQSIARCGSLSVHLGEMYGSHVHCRLMEDHATKCTIRNIWIKQTLSHYLTTVEEQLLRETQNGR